MKLTKIYYPFLFAIFPIIFLWSHNSSEASLSEIVYPIILAEIVVVCLFLGIRIWIKNAHRVGLVVTALLVWFFSYGHVLNILENIFPFSSATRPYLLLAWTLFWGFVIYYFLKHINQPERYARVLSVCALILLCLSIGTGTLSFLTSKSVIPVAVPEYGTPRAMGQPYPDIYYIILDGHARSDILQDIYGADNSAFIKHLSDKGFYVADQSHSNYSFTDLSLGSSLNLDYIPDNILRLGRQSASLAPVTGHLRGNILIETLKKAGYQILSFDSGVSITALQDTDVTLRPIWGLSELQNSLLATTIVPECIFSVTRLLGPHYDIQYALHRSRIKFIFDKLGLLASKQQKRPRFIFAHIVAPHAPFVFDANGNPTESHRPFSFLEESRYFIRLEGVEQYRSKYREQLAFIDSMAASTIDTILRHSARPPIIVLQSDHGPSSVLGTRAPYDLSSSERPLLETYFRERMSILNAYYFPDHAYTRLYPAITPVNSFRLILDQYLGMSYPLISDHSLFSSWEYPYEFQDVTDQLQASAP